MAMLLETGGSAAGAPKPIGAEPQRGRLQLFVKHARQWLIAIVFLPAIVVAMLVKPEWFTTSDE
jgi:hypothetical protein